jgi:hypothetical protein
MVLTRETSNGKMCQILLGKYETFHWWIWVVGVKQKDTNDVMEILNYF